MVPPSRTRPDLHPITGHGELEEIGLQFLLAITLVWAKQGPDSHSFWISSARSNQRGMRFTVG